VAKALQLTGGMAVEETVKFITMFDKFFDAFNVNSYDTGRRQRKIFKQPYRSGLDFRLKVWTTDIMGQHYMDICRHHSYMCV